MKWADYQSRVRYYDICTQRVERSVEILAFETTLVDFLERKYPGDPVTDDLAVIMADQFPKYDCGVEPEFFN